ncbi:hypothetical protein BESB_034360 [Besnoitia besnoiti]|uniref:RING-type domain-containing protein n=1 Tax=Besnoitia besnoiti TaxID=94643 RepID=A0A2A9MEN9_BESBE|nr:hypothetical protein BESB_034360 [Besnoitia besnoiti]PFH36978.1 hypothetical protein BESB_034360 [Besnoitia besnoiti]
MDSSSMPPDQFRRVQDQQRRLWLVHEVRQQERQRQQLRAPSGALPASASPASPSSASSEPRPAPRLPLQPSSSSSPPRYVNPLRERGRRPPRTSSSSSASSSSSSSSYPPFSFVPASSFASATEAELQRAAVMTMVSLPDGRRLRRQVQPGDAVAAVEARWRGDAGGRSLSQRSSSSTPRRWLHDIVGAAPVARASEAPAGARRARSLHPVGEPEDGIFASPVRDASPPLVFPFASASAASRSAAAAALASRRYLRQPHQRQRLQRQLAALGTSMSAASTSAVDALQRGLSPLLLSSDGAISGLAWLLQSAGGVLGVVAEENDPGDIRPQLQEHALRLLRNRKVKRIQLVSDASAASASSSFFRRDAGALKAITTYYTEEDFKCPICFEIFLRPVVTPCLHIFCRDCMLAVLLRTSMCPLCRGPVYAEQLEPIEACSSEKVVDFALNYLLLPVGCTQCYWQGPVSSWASNHNARRCRRIARHLRRTDPAPKPASDASTASSTTASSASAPRPRPPSEAERRRQEEAQVRDAFFLPHGQAEGSTGPCGASRPLPALPAAPVAPAAVEARCPAEEARPDGGRSGSGTAEAPAGAAVSATAEGGSGGSEEEEFAGEVEREPSALELPGGRERTDEGEARLLRSQRAQERGLRGRQDSLLRKLETAGEEDAAAAGGQAASQVEGMGELIAFLQAHLPEFGKASPEASVEESPRRGLSEAPKSAVAPFPASFGVCTRVCMVTHRMENVAGAVGGFFFGSGTFAHMQAVLEFRPAPEEEEEAEGRRQRRRAERRALQLVKQKGSLDVQRRSSSGLGGGIVSWFTGPSPAASGIQTPEGAAEDAPRRQAKKGGDACSPASASDEEEDRSSRITYLSLEWLGEGPCGRMDWQVSPAFPAFRPSAIKMFVYRTEEAGDAPPVPSLDSEELFSSLSFASPSASPSPAHTSSASSSDADGFSPFSFFLGRSSEALGADSPAAGGRRARAAGRPPRSAASEARRRRACEEASGGLCRSRQGREAGEVVRRPEDRQVVYLPGAVLLQLLLQVQTRPYRVLGWNCRDFCNLLLNCACTHPSRPQQVIRVPRPTGHCPSLRRFLASLEQEGMPPMPLPASPSAPVSAEASCEPREESPPPSASPESLASSAAASVSEVPTRSEAADDAASPARTASVVSLASSQNEVARKASRGSLVRHVTGRLLRRRSSAARDGSPSAAGAAPAVSSPTATGLRLGLGLGLGRRRSSAKAEEPRGELQQSAREAEAKPEEGREGGEAAEAPGDGERQEESQVGMHTKGERDAAAAAAWWVARRCGGFGSSERYPRYELGVKTIFLCLFGAEDRNRAALRPAAQMLLSTAKWWRSIFGSRESLQTGASSAATCASSSPSGAFAGAASGSGSGSGSAASGEHAAPYLPTLATPLPSSKQLRLRYETLPVLLLELQVRDRERAAERGEGVGSLPPEKIGFLSLEFRSDVGVQWHFYRQRPPGLEAAESEGGTSVVVSASLTSAEDSVYCFAELQRFLDEIRDREYHPTKWSSWDFVDSMLMRCAPQEATDLLLLPIAELQ